MPTVGALLERGYFPRELPPPFTTVRFASYIAQNLATLPACFSSKDPTKGECGLHLLARGGDEPRPLGIPNPVPYQRLTRLLVEHWTRVERLTQNTTLSLSRPVDGTAPGRAVQPLRTLTGLAQDRAQIRFRGRWMLRADVSRFYPSIYSHALAWAVEGKSRSRAGTKRMFGNRLDTLVRACQARQSVGIPIGPDTSLVLAELLMAPLDRRLRSAFRSIHGFRHVDDFELVFDSRAQAEDCLAHLRSELRDRRLALNPGKTSVAPLPGPFEKPWARRLRQWSFRPGPGRQAADLSDYFDLAFSLAAAHPEDQVVKYALGRIRNVTVLPQNLSLFQAYLFQAAVGESGALPFLYELLTSIHHGTGHVTLDTLAQVANETIVRSIRLRLDSEVAWSLWLLLAFDLEVSRAAAKALNESHDSICLLLALWLRDRGLMNQAFRVSRLAEYMTTEALWGEQWLFAYEVNVKGWLPNPGSRDYVGADARFSLLRAAGVYFLETAGPAMPPPYTANRLPVGLGAMSLA